MTYSPPVNVLLKLGEQHLQQKKWPDYTKIYGFTAEHIPALIQMAIDQELNWAESDSLDVWAPVHAWRTLGQLKAEEAIEPLLSVFHLMEDSNWFMEDMPQVFALIGPASIPKVVDFLANSENAFYCRWTAASILVKVGQTYPAVKAECVAGLEQQLERFAKNSRDLNGVLVSSLMDLEAQESAPLIERAFAAKWVDLSIAGDWIDVQYGLGLLSRAEVYERRRHVDAEQLMTKASKLPAEPAKGFGSKLPKNKKKRTKS
ncbi:PBS lyase [filamentous cyanobacterium CCP3]|nr:PBS lyase [filamentous cyanobacterium CCP3]